MNKDRENLHDILMRKLSEGDFEMRTTPEHPRITEIGKQKYYSGLTNGFIIGLVFGGGLLTIIIFLLSKRIL